MMGPEDFSKVWLKPLEVMILAPLAEASGNSKY